MLLICAKCWCGKHCLQPAVFEVNVIYVFLFREERGSGRRGEEFREERGGVQGGEERRSGGGAEGVREGWGGEQGGGRRSEDRGEGGMGVEWE